MGSCPILDTQGRIRWPHEYKCRSEHVAWADNYIWQPEKKGLSWRAVKQRTSFKAFTVNCAYSKACAAGVIPTGVNKTSGMLLYDVSSENQAQQI